MKVKKIYIFVLDITRMGGTERAVINLYNILEKRGFEVYIISISGKKKSLPYYSFDNLDHIEYLECDSLQKTLWNEIRWLYRFFKKLCHLKLPADAILLGTGHNISLVLILFNLLQGRRKKVIACEHIQLATIPKVVRLGMKFAYSYLDAIVVLSLSAKREFKTYLSKDKSVYVIPNSLPFSSSDLSNVENKRIIMVGRLSEEKGYERVIPIAKYLEQNHPEWRIDIFGSGPLEIELTQQFRDAGIRNVVFKGSVKKIMDEYLKSSILMMTSYTEAMPMVILEANACGVPVIAYACSGTKAMISDGENGFLIQNNNFKDYCTKLDIMISNELLRKEMSENSYNLSKKYSKEEVAILWDELFQRIS